MLSACFVCGQRENAQSASYTKDEGRFSCVRAEFSLPPLHHADLDVQLCVDVERRAEWNRQNGQFDEDEKYIAERVNIS